MSRPSGTVEPDWQLREAQERVAEQAALVRRRIVQGTPSQSAEDQLRNLEQTLARMKDQRGRSRVSAIKRQTR